MIRTYGIEYRNRDLTDEVCDYQLNKKYMKKLFMQEWVKSAIYTFVFTFGTLVVGQWNELTLGITGYSALFGLLLVAVRGAGKAVIEYILRKIGEKIK